MVLKNEAGAFQYSYFLISRAAFAIARNVIKYIFTQLERRRTKTSGKRK
jgi:hypothetical protein